MCISATFPKSGLKVAAFVANFGAFPHQNIRKHQKHQKNGVLGHKNNFFAAPAFPLLLKKNQLHFFK